MTRPAIGRVAYTVAGQWAASGSAPDRHTSIFWFGGANADASVFLVAAGDLIFTSDPNVMQVAVSTANAGDGGDYGYNGELVRTDTHDSEPWDL
jgi:hypothetical protein